MNKKQKLVFKYLDVILKNIKYSESTLSIQGFITSNIPTEKNIFFYSKESKAFWVNRKILTFIMNMFDMSDNMGTAYILEYVEEKFPRISEMEIKSFNVFS